MTTPDPIELPEGIHGPVRPADVPGGWEWKYALYDPHTKGCWHADAPAPSRYMVWVREPEPEPATIEIDADLALRLANDASLATLHGSKTGSTAAERALLRAEADKAMRAMRANR